MDEVIDFLNGRTGASEAAKVTTYSVYLHSREVAVTVSDHGPEAGHLRYSAEARYAEPSDGRELEFNSYGWSSGNPDDTVKGALFNVHWNVFRESED